MPRSRATIRDVAARAGVSHQTVSRVINNSERVSPETRAQVEQAIAELDYRPNAIARIMARGRTGTLAVIAPNLTDYAFASIIDGAEREARRQGYFLLAASAPDEDTLAALIDRLVTSRRVDGLMVINAYTNGRFQPPLSDFPTIFAGARPHAEGIAFVALDDVVVGREAAEHLISLGHRHIGLITGPTTENCTRDRTAGFHQALAAAKIEPLPALVYEGNWAAASGYEALHHIAKQEQSISAIIAQNDQMAVGALRAARELDWCVPEQLSVIGVDDTPLATFFDPPLTTLRQDFNKIGRYAANLLISAIKYPDQPRQPHRLPAELIVRESTASPNDL